jgi:hypothetical protein
MTPQGLSGPGRIGQSGGNEERGCRYTRPMPEPKLYQFSTHIGAACAKQFRNFPDLAEKLKMPLTDLMQQVNAKAPPSRATAKGLARELDIDESFLEKLADEVRKDLGGKAE